MMTENDFVVFLLILLCFLLSVEDNSGKVDAGKSYS